MRQWRTASAVLAALTIAMAACGQAPTGGGASPAASAAEQPTPGGRVIYGSFSDIQRLNPATSNDATSSQVSGKIYDALIRVDAKDAAVKPNLGQWTVSSDGLTFSWTIDAKANQNYSRAKRTRAPGTRSKKPPQKMFTVNFRRVFCRALIKVFGRPQM